MGFVPKTCVRCGATFAASRQAHTAKYCPVCKPIVARERTEASHKRLAQQRKADSAGKKPKKSSEKPKKKYKSLDEHVRALNAAGISYAEEQRRSTIEQYARLDLKQGKG